MSSTGSRAFLVDAAERILATFLEAFLGVLLIAPAVDISTLETAAAAGIAAGLAALKTLAAAIREGTLSPASLAGAPSVDLVPMTGTGTVDNGGHVTVDPPQRPL